MPRIVRALVFAASATLLLSHAPAQAGGKEIFLSKGCNTCHSVPTGKVQRLIASEKAPDLVNLAERYTHLELVALLRQELKIDGKEVHKRLYKGDEELMAQMVDWLLAQTDDRFKGAKRAEAP